MLGRAMPSPEQKQMNNSLPHCWDLRPLYVHSQNIPSQCSVRNFLPRYFGPWSEPILFFPGGEKSQEVIRLTQNRGSLFSGGGVRQIIISFSVQYISRHCCAAPLCPRTRRGAINVRKIPACCAEGGREKSENLKKRLMPRLLVLGTCF